MDIHYQRLTTVLCCNSHNELETTLGLDRNFVKAQTFLLDAQEVVLLFSMGDGLCLTKCETTELTHSAGA